MPAHKKDDSVRRRSNSSSSAKIVLHPLKGRKVIPPLPTNIKWYPHVKDWWKRAWSSPMSQMWSDPDRDAMYLAARLQQQFWDPTTTSSTRNQTSAQIRAIMDQCGLTPISRHRMGWELADPDEAPPTGRRAPAKAQRATVTQIDPRKRRIAAVK